MYEQEVHQYSSTIQSQLLSYLKFTTILSS